jgi:hypothetical protein
MKKCYNKVLLWVGVFAILLVVVVSIQPYNTFFSKTEKYTTEPNGEDPNNHSCVKIMKSSPYLKAYFDKFNKNAKTIASVLDPGLSDQYMETDSVQVLKGMCIIPDGDKMTSYKLNIESDPNKGGTSSRCRAVSQNGKIDLVLPYINDKVSGCGIVFSEYGNNPKKIERVLNDLYYLSNEENEKVKAKVKDQKNEVSSTLEILTGVNRGLVRRANNNNGKKARTDKEVNELQPTIDMHQQNNEKLMSINSNLKNRLTSTW